MCDAQIEPEEDRRRGLVTEQLASHEAESHRPDEGDDGERDRDALVATKDLEVEVEPREVHEVQQPDRAQALDERVGLLDDAQHVRADEQASEEEPEQPREPQPFSEPRADCDHDEHREERQDRPVGCVEAEQVHQSSAGVTITRTWSGSSASTGRRYLSNRSSRVPSASSARIARAHGLGVVGVLSEARPPSARWS